MLGILLEAEDTTGTGTVEDTAAEDGPTEDICVDGCIVEISDGVIEVS